MRYLFVNTHYIPEYHYGGVVESGSRLFLSLKRHAEFRLATSSSSPRSASSFLSPGDKCYQSRFFHRFGFSLEAIFGLWRDVRACDVVFVNGIVAWLVSLAQIYAVILRKPFIVSTRGGVEPWRVNHKRWKKLFYLKFLVLPLMRRAAYIHVTSEQEFINVKALGFDRVLKISNGVEVCSLKMDSPAPEPQGKFVFLFLSRTDREKGLDILIGAYRRFCREFATNGHILKVVGPDLQGYLAGMGLDLSAENIAYSAGVYGAAKLNILHAADVLVLPSYSENFGNVVAEALACETPVITTTGTPWSEIEEVGCGLYVEPEAEALYQAMKAMYLKSPEERREMGRRGREYVLKNFNWEDKARELFNHLEKLASKGKM